MELMRKLMGVASFISVVPITFLLISFIVVRTKERFESLISKKKLFKIMVGWALVGPVLFAISYILHLFLSSMWLTYKFIYWITNILTSSEELSIYLGLTLTLILFAYFPAKLGYYFLLWIGKLLSKDSNMHNTYNKFVTGMRMKIIIYFISFFVVLVSSMENYLGYNIFSSLEWSKLKPYILQSVITFIAYDRFNKALFDEIEKKRNK